MRLYLLSNPLALCVARLAFDYSSSTSSFSWATPTYDNDEAGASSVVHELDEPLTLCRTTRWHLYSFQRACGGVCGEPEETAAFFFSRRARSLLQSMGSNRTRPGPVAGSFAWCQAAAHTCYRNRDAVIAAPHLRRALSTSAEQAASRPLAHHARPHPVQPPRGSPQAPPHQQAV